MVWLCTVFYTSTVDTVSLASVISCMIVCCRVWSFYSVIMQPHTWYCCWYYQGAMGSSSSKFRKHIQSGDEYAAIHLYSSSSDLRKALDPNLSYGDSYNHDTPMHMVARHAMKSLLRLYAQCVTLTTVEQLLISMSIHARTFWYIICYRRMFFATWCHASTVAVHAVVMCLSQVRVIQKWLSRLCK